MTKNIVGSSGRHLGDDNIVSWDKAHHDELVRRNYEELAANVKLLHGGLAPLKVWEYEAQIFLMASLINLHGIEATDVKKHLIVKTFIQMLSSENESRNIARFQKMLADEVRLAVARPLLEHHVVLPLNIGSIQPTKLPYLDVLDTRLHFSSWKEVINRFDVEAWKRYCPNENQDFFKAVNLRRYTPVIVTAESRDPGEAFEEANDRFDLLRTALNMEYTWGRTRTIIFGRPEPLSELSAPPIYAVFKADGKHSLTYFANEIRGRVKDVKLSQSQIATAKRLLRRLQPAPGNEIKPLLVDAVRLYGQATDSINWREGFLSLWQILELVTHRPNAQYNIKEVQRKVTTLLGEDQLFTDILALSGEARNSLVHRGQFSDEGLSAFMMLKSVVEYSLTNLVHLSKSYSTWEKLETYYKYASVKPAQVEEAIKTMRHIQRMRQKIAS